MLTTTVYSNDSQSSVGQVTLLTSKRNADQGPQTLPASHGQQLCFDWDASDAIASQVDHSTDNLNHDLPPEGDATTAGDAPEIRRIRKLKRIAIGNPVRGVPGGELWESAESASETSPATGQSAAPAARPVSSPVPRPIPRAKRQQRSGGPVRIGATMLKLLKTYGITDAEIAAGIAAYADRTCHATAS